MAIEVDMTVIDAFTPSPKGPRLSAAAASAAAAPAAAVASSRRTGTPVTAAPAAAVAVSARKTLPRTHGGVRPLRLAASPHDSAAAASAAAALSSASRLSAATAAAAGCAEHADTPTSGAGAGAGAGIGSGAGGSGGSLPVLAESSQLTAAAAAALAGLPRAPAGAHARRVEFARPPRASGGVSGGVSCVLELPPGARAAVRGLTSAVGRLSVPPAAAGAGDGELIVRLRGREYRARQVPSVTLLSVVCTDDVAVVENLDNAFWALEDCGDDDNGDSDGDDADAEADAAREDDWAMLERVPVVIRSKSSSRAKTHA
jgi:hypothetical protein